MRNFVIFSCAIVALFVASTAAEARLFGRFVRHRSGCGAQVQQHQASSAPVMLGGCSGGSCRVR